jgi:hypothetical protein
VASCEFALLCFARVFTVRPRLSRPLGSKRRFRAKTNPKGALSLNAPTLAPCHPCSAPSHRTAVFVPASRPERRTKTAGYGTGVFQMLSRSLYLRTAGCRWPDTKLSFSLSSGPLMFSPAFYERSRKSRDSAYRIENTPCLPSSNGSSNYRIFCVGEAFCQDRKSSKIVS